MCEKLMFDYLLKKLKVKLLYYIKIIFTFDLIESHRWTFQQEDIEFLMLNRKFVLSTISNIVYITVEEFPEKITF